MSFSRLRAKLTCAAIPQPLGKFGGLGVPMQSLESCKISIYVDTMSTNGPGGKSTGGVTKQLEVPFRDILNDGASGLYKWDDLSHDKFEQYIAQALEYGTGMPFQGHNNYEYFGESVTTRSMKLEPRNSIDWKKWVEENSRTGVDNWEFTYIVKADPYLAVPLDLMPKPKKPDEPENPEEPKKPDEQPVQPDLLAFEEPQPQLVADDADGGPEDEISFGELAANISDNDCSQFNADRWAECCEFFLVRPELHQDPQNKIKLGNLDRDFYPYQAYAIYYMLCQARDAGGGFVGDEPGLGKTTEALGYCIVEFLIALQWHKIETDRNLSGGLHNTAAAAPLAAGCPSAQDSWIRCPCFGTVDHFPCFSARSGPSLIITPASLLPSWEKEFLDMMKVTRGTQLDMKLHLCHANGRIAKAALTDTNIPYKKLLDSAKATGGQHPRDIINSLYKASTTYVMLTSRESFSKYVGNPDFYEGVYWGRVIRDEFHLMKAITAKFIKTDLMNLLGSPILWALSGTPFETSPEDMHGYVKVLRKWCNGDRTWKRTPQLWNSATTKNFDKLIEDYQKQTVEVTSSQIRSKALLSNDQRAQEEAQAETAKTEVQKRFGAFLKAFMIRRVTEHKWFSQSMHELHPFERHVQGVPLEPQYEGHLRTMRFWFQQDLERKLGQGSILPKDQAVHLAEPSRILTICETIPGIAAAILDRKTIKVTAWKLTVAEIEKKKWMSDNSASNLYILYRPIMQTAPKVLELVKIIDGKGLDYLNRCSKIIIFSAHPAVIFAIFLILRAIPRYNGKVIMISQQTKHRAELLKGFNAGSGPIADDQDAPANGRQARTRAEKDAAVQEGREAEILLSTPNLIGVGHTLNRAHHVVMVEASLSAAARKQAFARVNRIGQRNVPHSYELVIADLYSWEQRIIRRRNNRADTSRLVFADLNDPNVGPQAGDPAVPAVDPDRDEEDAYLDTLPQHKRKLPVDEDEDGDIVMYDSDERPLMYEARAVKKARTEARARNAVAPSRSNRKNTSTKRNNRGY